MTNTISIPAKIALFILLTFGCTPTTFARLFWTPTLINWTIYIDNGVIYIASPSMPSNCTYQRAQVDPDLKTGKSVYAFALKSQALGEQISIVVDDQQSICVATGIRNG